MGNETEKPVLLTDQEILSQLKIVGAGVNKIPDVRDLQRRRLRSVGTLNKSEEIAKKAGEERYREYRRILLLPEPELRRVYSLALPLSFASAEYAGEKTHFSRWCGQGLIDRVTVPGRERYIEEIPMHLTTFDSFQKLLEIFVEHKVPFLPDESVAWRGLIDNGRVLTADAGITASYSHYCKHMSLEHWFFDHQFIVCQEKIFASPYWVVVEVECEDREGIKMF